MTARLLETQPHQARARVDELAGTLDLIAGAVPAPLAEDRLRTVRAQIDLFGLHAARLDLREDAGRLAGAFDRAPPRLGRGGRRPRGDRGRAEPRSRGPPRRRPARRRGFRPGGPRRPGARDLGAVPAARPGAGSVRARALRAVRDLDDAVGRRRADGPCPRPLGRRRRRSAGGAALRDARRSRRRRRRAGRALRAARPTAPIWCRAAASRR